MNEQQALREVYESARSVLRYNGVDRWEFEQAFQKLGDAIEKVKLIDGGYGLEGTVFAAQQLPAAPASAEVIGVDDLAQIIRFVDGWHQKGAGALAESIIGVLALTGKRLTSESAHPAPQAAPQQPVAFRWALQGTFGLPLEWSRWNDMAHFKDAQRCHGGTNLVFEYATQQDKGYPFGDGADVKAAAALSTWHPIETAPMNAQVLCGWWGWGPDGDVWIVEAREAGNTRAGTRHGQATHWMPLPPPNPITPATVPERN